jgi:HSP20 family protein
VRGMSLETTQALELLRRRLYPLLEGNLGERQAAPRERLWTPPAEVRFTDKEVVLSLEIPGVPREAVEVNLQGTTLTVAGTRHRPAEDDERQVHQAERPMGDFSRSFTVPWALEAESTAAKLENGVLTIRAKRVA